MIALIDNYDSFTFNLYQYLSEFAQVKVFRNDEVTMEQLKELDIKGIVISPGPGRPENAGISVELIRELGNYVPMLGICLGHQAIAVAYGGEVVKSNNIYHGKTSIIDIKMCPLFKDVDKSSRVMRYHSLIVDKKSLPKELEVLAETTYGQDLMALKHREYDVYGLQFHPESIYTSAGKIIIKNFVQEVCHVYR